MFRRFKIILLVCLIPFLTGATTYMPPQDTALSTQTQQYLTTLYENLNNLEVVTTNPNGNRRGKYGNLVLYNNSGTYNVMVCTSSPNGTAWTNAVTVPSTALSESIGNFTRDLTLGGGAQSITGVGFKPKVVLLFALVAATREESVGFDDGTNLAVIYDNWTGATYNTGGITVTLLESSTVYSQCYITSLDNDGFTVTWSKNGSPTGTGKVYYLALK